MTLKKQRKILAKQIRKACKGVFAYPETHSLAKAILDYSWINPWFEKRGFSVEMVTLCECCGVNHYLVKGRGYTLTIPYLQTEKVDNWNVTEGAK